MTVATQERSEVQRAEDTAAAQQQQWATAPSSVLQQFAADARAAYTTAISIAKTPFVPTSYKQTGRRQNRTWLSPEAVAANVTAAWLAGEEIGLRPMQSLAAIDIIEGRPALSAQSMRALVQGHGHDVWVEEQPVPNTSLTALAVTVAGLRKGQPESRIQRVTWTWNRARQAGLVEKDNWQNHPVEMLIARGTSAVCRLIASDVLMGLAYSAEELADELGTGEDAVPTKGTVSRRRSTGVGRAPIRVVAGGKEESEPEPEEPAAEPEEEREEGEEPSGEPEPSEEPSSPGRPTKRDDEEATEERGSLEGESAAARLGVACNHESGDGRYCSREPGHGGRHFYGRKDAPNTQPAPEPSGPSPETLHGASVAEYEPSEEERAEAEEGPDQGELYPEPSQEELDRAWEAEQEAARAREAEAQAASQPAQQQEPAWNEPPDDDPWADFR